MKTNNTNSLKVLILSLVIFTAGSMAVSFAADSERQELNYPLENSIILELIGDYAQEEYPGVESWMFDINYWNSWRIYADEGDLGIEDWMINPGRWQINRLNNCARLQDVDPVIEENNLDYWMVDTNRWTISG